MVGERDGFWELVGRVPKTSQNHIWNTKDPDNSGPVLAISTVVHVLKVFLFEINLWKWFALLNTNVFWEKCCREAGFTQLYTII